MSIVIHNLLYNIAGYNIVVSLHLDELYINKQTYTVDNLHLLPDHNNPTILSYRSNDTTYVTGGLYSQYNLLSNWSKTPFSYNGIRYDDTEQCCQHHKAVRCSEDKVAYDILCTPDPRDAKELGRSISMTVQQRKTWEAGREGLMTRMARAKANQNENVAVALRSQDRTPRLGETGVHDPYYTIGMMLTNPRVLNSNE